MIRRTQALGLFILLCFSLSLPAMSAEVSGARVTGAKSAPANQKELSTNLSLTHTLTSVELSELTTEESSDLKSGRTGNNQKAVALKVGVGRELSNSNKNALKMSSLNWSSNAEGKVAALSIDSRGAKSIRMALSLENLDADKVDGVTLRFFGTKNNTAYGPYSLKKLIYQTLENDQGKKIYWSPVLDGSVAGMEISVPNDVQLIDIEGLTIPQISHLDISLLTGDLESLSDIGRSGSCNIDVRCHEEAWGNIADAVAKYVITENGNTGLCTGTALNDTDESGFIPYFITANHCVSTQSGASTINTFWFFEKASCNGANPTSVSQLTGGATLLHTDSSIDHTLLQLNDALLPGTWVSAWTTTPDITNITGIHHPSGDLKKISFGSSLGRSSYAGSTVNDNGTHLRVQWSSGTTEGGSSGSGLFIENGGSQYLVGTLHGGAASCTAQSSPDYYGRFDLAFPSISNWLAGNGGSSGGDVYEPDNSIGTASFAGATGSFSHLHNIHTAGDTDWIKFTLPSTATVTLATSSPSGETTTDDTRMWLYDANGSLLEFDDDSGNDLYSRMTGVLTAGDYYIKIAGNLNNNTIGAYRITLSSS